MADKQHRMLVFFKIGDYGYKDVVAVCADNTSCPVFDLLDACKTYYATYRHVPNRLRAVSVATLKDKNATNSMITLTEYVCKNCKNRVR